LCARRTQAISPEKPSPEPTTSKYDFIAVLPHP
jgi:hypothetical protein